jgi:hypothetical protein
MPTPNSSRDHAHGVNAAAKKLMRARAELKEAGAAEPTRPATDAAAQADAF